MYMNSRKIVIIGTGMVGMSYAYALLNQNICDELVLIDLDRRRAEGEAMDLSHGLAFSASNMKIYAGDYSDCAGADIAAVCAGVAQKPGESRLNLLQSNTEVFQSIFGAVVSAGFQGIFLIATNPVDIMTRVAQVFSGFERGKVIGTGTALDTARLRYRLGQYFSVDPRNVHAYVMGEHGDSELIPWSQALIATKPILTILEEEIVTRFCRHDLDAIAEEVRGAAQKIIQAKKATYYGIGMAMARITRAVLGDENSVLTVSSMLQGEYGLTDVYIGTPCIVGREGIKATITLALSDQENTQLARSAELLQDTFQELQMG